MGSGFLRRLVYHLAIFSMGNAQIKLRPFLRPIVRWAKYFSYNTHFIDGDKIKLQGAEKVRQHLIENPNHYIKLQEDVKAMMGIK